MNAYIRIALLLCVLASATLCTTAQSPFKASQGKATALTSAKQAGFTTASLTSIATLGDTAFFGSFIPAQVKSILNFDASKGTSTFWGYRFSDVIGGKDTTVAYVVIKPLIYLALQTPLPDLPNLPIQLDSALPSTFMDSDVMTQKILASPLYKSYIAAHPKAKFQAAALGTSRGGIFPSGPLWVAFIGYDVNGESLTCYVEAANDAGTATCALLPASDVKDDATAESVKLYPNPSSTGSLMVHIPLEKYSPVVHFDVYSILGEHLKSFPLHQLAGGTDVHLDCSALAHGSYQLVLRDANGVTRLPFSIDK